MKHKFLHSNFGNHLQKAILFTIAILATVILNAQTISTAGGIGYNADYTFNSTSPQGISFVIENTTAVPVALTNVNMQIGPSTVTPAGTPAITKLFYSTTSLSGNYDLATFTQIGTGTAIVPAVATSTPVISGISFLIPANSQYRFVIEISRGLLFSFNPEPTPNIFSVNGINLKVGKSVIGTSNVGYAGVSPIPNAANTPCFFGGSVTLAPTGPCAGTPAPGNTIASTSATCPGVNFTLSQQNATSGSGVTYQWQYGPTATGPWTSPATAINSTFVTTQTVATYYRSSVSCGGITVFSDPVLVNMSLQCYCAAGGGSTIVKIGNVTFANINQTSSSAAIYENYLVDTIIIERSGTENFSALITNPVATYNTIMAWIDYNQDGDFTDAGETVLTTAQSAGPTFTGVVVTPATALLGYTRMRIRSDIPILGGNATSCGVSTYGQVEDYTVKIIPCTQLSISAQPINTSITCGSTATFTLAGVGAGITYQWQQRNSATGAWLPLTNGGLYSGVSTKTLSVGAAPETLSGYQYRVLYGGNCTTTDFSSIATLTVTPLLPTLSTTAVVQCSNAAQSAQLISIITPASATGIWTPTTGLYTNAAATIPYTGTAVNSVYALPGVSTSYSVIVTTATCVAAPLLLSITVNIPVTGAITVANKSVCINGNTTFEASAPAAGNVLHQWKLSTNGTTYTNITNGSVYSGATTPVLTITGATASMNGYQYKDSAYVNVCNSFVNSNAAVLTVNSTPIVTISFNSAATALYPGITTSLKATVLPNAAASYTWLLNGNIIPNATSNVLSNISVDGTGTYKANVIDVNGCVGTSNSLVVSDSATTNLYIYPNPNQGNFHVRYYSKFNGTSTGGHIVSLFDSKGAKIYTKSFATISPYTDMEINMGSLSAGVYVIEVTDNKGKRLSTGQVLIK